MPLIEELPITQSHRVTHGWAYVPDITPIAAIQPGSRKGKRNRDTTATTTHATAKQLKAVQARLDSLDKENYRDGVAVPIPAKRDAGKKVTQNVRRILTYQRGFAHYLADEEANAAGGGVGGGNVGVVAQTQASGREVRRKTNVVEAQATNTKRGRMKEKEKEKEKMAPPTKLKRESDADVAMTDAPPSTTTSTSTSTPSQPQPTNPTPKYDKSLDTHPLLQTTFLPKMPSDRVMNLLLSEPPLSYTAARATTDDIAKPTRRFCGVCGYWGKVKCKRCGECTCGILECWTGHAGVCVAGPVY